MKWRLVSPLALYVHANAGRAGQCGSISLCRSPTDHVWCHVLSGLSLRCTHSPSYQDCQSVAHAFPRVSSTVLCLTIKTKAEPQTAWSSSRVRTMLTRSQASPCTVSKVTQGTDMSWNNPSIGQALHTTRSRLICKQDLHVETAAHHTWTRVCDWVPHNKAAPAETGLRQECSYRT